MKEMLTTTEVFFFCCSLEKQVSYFDQKERNLEEFEKRRRVGMNIKRTIKLITTDIKNKM